MARELLPTRPIDAAEFERRMRETRPLAPSVRTQALAAIAETIDAEAAHLSVGRDLDAARAHADKWLKINDYIASDPFRDRARLTRSDQWREALARLRAIGEPALIEWLALQVEVSRNLERGVHEMRQRKGGPTWILTLEFTGVRRKRAAELLRWAEGAAKDGYWSTLDHHPPTIRRG